MSGMAMRSTTRTLSSWPSMSGDSSMPSISTIPCVEAVATGIGRAQAPRAASATVGMRRTVPARSRSGSSIPLSSAIARQ